MRLIVFDVDNTLTQSQAIDEEIYLNSLHEVFGFTGVNADWSCYEHASDTGILREVFTTQVLRLPTANEVATFRAHFVAGIDAAALEQPFREIPGAGRLLHHLQGLPSCRVALATGGFSDSARCKMRSADLNYDAFATASADDAFPRTEIVQIAIERARVLEGGRCPETILYVGDGVWDARACRELGLPFVGIATGQGAARLLAEGAQTVFPGLRRSLHSCRRIGLDRHLTIDQTQEEVIIVEVASETAAS
jgi:phosphoglycolate phosphatase-like HAD superfamily hydrolase